MSVLPSYWPVKATTEPSGEDKGLASTPAALVKRVASPPERGTCHRSPANWKTILFWLKVGRLSRSGGASDPCPPSRITERRSIGSMLCLLQRGTQRR